MPDAWLVPVAGAFGLLIGSFLNACIHRWPRDLSVVHPRSRCPSCETQIAWFDNVPVLSWLLLRGRCRHCRTAISWRYPLVELLTAAAFAWFASRGGVSARTAKDCVLGAMLIALAFSDVETRILPDELTLGGALVGLVFSFLVPVPDQTFHFAAALAGVAPSPRIASAGEALLGAVVCSGSLWLAGWIFEKLRHKEGLGFGDVKMLAMIGTFLGLSGALLTIVLGSIAGAVVGLTYIRLTGRDAATYELPFGAFLAFAAFLTVAAGPSLLAWYERGISTL